MTSLPAEPPDYTPYYYFLNFIKGTLCGGGCIALGTLCGGVCISLGSLCGVAGLPSALSVGVAVLPLALSVGVSVENNRLLTCVKV